MSSLAARESFGSLIVVVHVIVHAILLHNWVLLIILFHQLEINLVVDLESASLDFLLPHVIMNLNVIKNGVYQDADVRILIRKKLKNN
jgi:hypothetical protein